jgi:polysaccharide biosynthesis protein PslH
VPARRGRALVLATWFPCPQDNGSRQRLWALLGGLAQTYDVDLVALVDEPVATEHVMAARERCARVEVVLKRRFAPRSGRAVAAFVHPFPRSVVATYTPEMRAAVDRLVAERRPDVVVVSQIHVARYALHLEDVPRVLDELEPGVLRGSGAADDELTWREHLTWSKVRRYVRRVVHEFDATTVVSEHERDNVLTLVPGAKVEVVPNGIDVERNRPVAAVPEQGTMIYPGAPTFDFNREAVWWFADEVLPAVRAARPDARLRVTGRIEGLPSTSLPRTAGVEYTGYLDDVRPTITSSWCTVVPLRRGGGTRLKVLESLALGTPVVSTTKGVEGLDLVAGKEVVVGDTANDVAAAIVELLGDAERRATLSEAGRRAVEERYDWRPIAQRFTELVQRVASR